MSTSFVYKITNTITGEVYIGIAGEVPARWTQHKRDMYKHATWPLYAAMLRYGIENFIVETVDEVFYEDFNEVLDREFDWMKACNSFYPNGYNLQKRKEK